MKRRYVGLAAIIGIIGVVAGVLLFRRAEPPIIGQATPVPTRPRPEYTPQPADAVAPIVVERSPERGEELPADGVVQLVFDRSMDRESVAAALSVSPSVDGTIEWANDRTLRFTPKQPLNRAALYDVVLSQGARATDGAALNSAYQFRFATAGYLEVAQALPADGSDEVEADAVITAVFNRPVVALKVAEDQDTQPQPLSFDPPLEGTGEWLSTSVYVFRPARPLGGGTTYTVSIKDLKDLDGNPLERPYSWSWTTVRPKLVFSTPAADETRAVGVDPGVMLEFNQPIDQASAERSIELRSTDGTAVPIGVAVYSETVYLSPTIRLEFDTRYEVVVAAGLQGVTGGAGMEDEFRLPLRTVPLPRILRTDPADGAQTADPFSDFTIVFNAPINPDTVLPNLQMTPGFTPTEVYSYFDSYNYEFHLGISLKPSTEYVVAIGPNIADPYGNLTGQSLDVRFKTAPLPPSTQLIVPAEVGTYNAANPTRVGLRSVNTAEASFELYRLPQDSLKTYSYQWNDRLPDGAESLRSWTETLQSPLDQSVVSRIDLVAGGGALEPGTYLLQLKNSDYYPQQHILVVSDLNMTLKSAEREALVWVNELSSGQPRAGVAVEFYDDQHASLGSATTDAQGVARIELERTENRGVIALAREPFGAIGAGWGGGTNAWDFGLESTWDLPEMTGHIYTDRPIYRPDQEVEFKGVIRAEDDVRFSLPSGSAINVTITSPTGEEIFKDELPLSDLGTFAGSVRLSAGATLGDYSLAASLGDNYFSHGFQVAAYRAPEYEVTVTPPADELVRGTAIKATVAANYFFGGPVANAPIQWNVLAEDYQFSPDWAGRYQFSASDDPWRCWECWWIPAEPAEPILSGSGTTDAQGKLSIELPANLTDSSGTPITRSVRLTIEATATGKDNQIISGRESLVVHGADRYIGLAPQTYVSKAGAEQKIDLVVADDQEKRVANQGVQVEIFQVTWDNTYVKNDQGGGSWQWTEQRTSVSRQTATSDSNGEAVIAWTPGEGGSYQVVATARDSGGRPVRSALFVWVAGDTYVAWRRDNNDRINLIADRTSYQPGETADILIPSPFQGPHWALISVERGGILSHEVRRMEGNSAIYRLPLTAEHAPNVYVSVVLFTGSDGPTNAPGYKVGLLPLAVEPAAQSLKIALTPSAEQAEPGQEISYAVQVSDQSGQPVAAELSLDLVDKAVLSLLPRTPDAIREAFYGRRGLGVQTANDLAVSADRLQAELEQELERQNNQNTTGGGTAPTEAPAATQAPGAGDLQYAVGAVAEDSAGAPAPMARMVGQQGGNAAPTVRGEFADTAYWNANVRTDSAGRAAVTIKLPDNLTTWVVRGVGLTGDTLVGEGVGDLVVTKPLLIRPVTPRFLVVDDTVELAANVSNNTDSPLQAQVWLTTSGLSVTDALTRSITVPARGEANVTWQATVQDVQAAGMVFSVTSGQYGDASKPRLATAPEGMLPVYRYSVPETVGTGGQLEAAGSRTEVIALPSNIDTRNGEVSVRLDPSLAAGMRDSLDYLEHYEYEGAEQTVSSFLPNVLTARALKELGVPNPELEARLPGLIEEGLTRLTVQQHDDGGWGWWVEAESNPYVSAYVVFALLQAQESGVEVKPEVIARGLDYLTTQLVATRSLNSYREANLQSWLLYVLGKGGRADGDRLSALYDARDKLSSYARALLAQSLHNSGAGLDDARIKTLLSDLNNAAIMSANGVHWEEQEYDWWSMNTDTRSTAIILNALVELDPASDLNPNVVRWLMVARKDGIWETTQESAWSIMALTNWMRYTGELKADYDYATWINDQERAAGHVDPAAVATPITLRVAVADLLSDQGNRLTIGRGEGAGRLYYTAYLRAFLPVEEVEALDRGVIVSRRYTLASCLDGPKCPEVSSAKLGETVRVELSIIAPNDLYYVQLEDPLPAGAELIDTGLATTSLLDEGPNLERSRPSQQPGQRGVAIDWYWRWWNWYSRSELRDEKVALFADYLPKGSYSYSYTMRATTPGQFHVIPTTAQESYFPEVYGRSDGQLFTVER